jgi:hypothetical protein
VGTRCPGLSPRSIPHCSSRTGPCNQVNVSCVAGEVSEEDVACALWVLLKTMVLNDAHMVLTAQLNNRKVHCAIILATCRNCTHTHTPFTLPVAPHLMPRQSHGSVVFVHPIRKLPALNSSQLVIAVVWASRRSAVQRKGETRANRSKVGGPIGVRWRRRRRRRKLLRGMRSRPCPHLSSFALGML